MKRFIGALLDDEMEEFIGSIPLLQRFFPNRGWYRWMPERSSSKDEPRGPYPTRDTAFMHGDPIPPQEIDYCLRMPVGCHDIRKQGDTSW